MRIVINLLVCVTLVMLANIDHPSFQRFAFPALAVIPLVYLVYRQVKYGNKKTRRAFRSLPNRDNDHGSNSAPGSSIA